MYGFGIVNIAPRPGEPGDGPAQQLQVFMRLNLGGPVRSAAGALAEHYAGRAQLMVE